MKRDIGINNQNRDYYICHIAHPYESLLEMQVLNNAKCEIIMLVGYFKSKKELFKIWVGTLALYMVWILFSVWRQ